MEASVTISEKDSAFNVLFYHNPLPAWIVETNTLRVIAVNDAAVRQYGYEREEFLKNTISLLNLPEEDESFNALFKKLEHNQAVKKQLTHLKKDGTPVYVNVTSYSVRFCNCCCGMIMVNGIAEKCRGSDIFNGHFTEVENLAFINSHMIRKPLANILGIIYALEACEQDECELAESINMLKLSADELDMVIRKINLQLEHRFI